MDTGLFGVWVLTLDFPHLRSFSLICVYLLIKTDTGRGDFKESQRREWAALSSSEDHL